MSERNQTLRPLNVGLIGCGRAAQHLHLPALSRGPAARVLALADSDQSQLDAASQRFAIRQTYLNYRQLLDDSEIDVVAVCVPTQWHSKIGLAVLQSGKHLFVEKPLALTLKECDALIQAASRAGRKTTVGFNLRHHRLVRKARALLQSESLGELEAFRSTMVSALQHRGQSPAWRSNRAQGGGVFFELAVHHVDLLRHLFGVEIVEVYATARSEGQAESAVNVNFKLASGLLATSVFSDWMGTDVNELEIFGRGGVLKVSLYQLDGLRHDTFQQHAGGQSWRLRQARQTLKMLPEFPGALRLGGDFKASYYYEWQSFLKAIRDDLPPAASLEDGRKALQVVLAMIESTDTGKSVKIRQG